MARVYMTVCLLLLKAYRLHIKKLYKLTVRENMSNNKNERIITRNSFTLMYHVYTS